MLWMKMSCPTTFQENKKLIEAGITSYGNNENDVTMRSAYLAIS